MITQQQIEFFEDNGYLIVPNVFDINETLEVRNKLMNLFDSSEISETDRAKGIGELPDLYYTHPEFISFTINDKILGIARQLLNDEKPILTKETSSHRGFYPNWHKDTTTVEKYGNVFHKSPDFNMVRFGVYFQDNNEYGGGLSVFAGSHKTADNFLMPVQERTIYRRIMDKFMPLSDEKSPKINPFNHQLIEIKSKVGDLVIFHFKTNHRATLPKICSPNEVPRQLAKISLFDTFGRNNETTLQYNEYLKSRVEPDYDLFRNRKDFSKELIRKAEELNFRLI